MKKLSHPKLFYFAGILCIFAEIINKDIRWGYALGVAFIALGIAMRIKDSFTEDSEEGELLTDAEEKQVWKEFQDKVEEDK